MKSVFLLLAGIVFMANAAMASVCWNKKFSAAMYDKNGALSAEAQRYDKISNAPQQVCVDSIQVLVEPQGRDDLGEEYKSGTALVSGSFGIHEMKIDGRVISFVNQGVTFRKYAFSIDLPKMTSTACDIASLNLNNKIYISFEMSTSPTQNNFPNKPEFNQKSFQFRMASAPFDDAAKAIYNQCAKNIEPKSNWNINTLISEAPYSYEMVTATSSISPAVY